jgi:hypothetical protein
LNKNIYVEQLLSVSSLLLFLINAVEASPFIEFIAEVGTGPLQGMG